MPSRRRKTMDPRMPYVYQALGDPALNVREFAGPYAVRRRGYGLNPRYAVPAVATAASFATRKYRQKPVVGLMNLDPRKNIGNKYMYSGGWTKQKVRGAGKPPTNRKNVGTKGGPKKSAPKRKTITDLNRKVNALRKAVNADRSFHTHRYAAAGNILNSDGQCNHEDIAPITPTLMEGYTNNLRYFDPSTPATLLTADSTTGTFSHDVKFKSIYSKLILRNNYMVPTKIKIYLCKVKHDTTYSPNSIYQNAIADQVVNASTDHTDPLVFLTDIERVKELYTIDCVFDKTLYAGQEAVVSHSEDDIDYDPSKVDMESATYQKMFKTFVWTVRIEGCLGHDSGGAAQYGIVDTAVDYQMLNTVKIEYDAGINLNDISFNDTRNSTFTTGGVVTVPSVPDNIHRTTG